MNHLRTLMRNITYSAVMSTLAFVMAVGGTSYAATVISGANIKDHSLTAKDIKNGSLTGKNVAADSLPQKVLQPGPLTQLRFHADFEVPSSDVCCSAAQGKLIAWNVEKADDVAMHSMTNPTRISIHTPGAYLIDIHSGWSWGADAPSSLATYVFRNGDGSKVLGHDTISNLVSGPGAASGDINVVQYLNAGDYLEVSVGQAGSGSQTYFGITDIPEISVRWIG